MRNLYLPSAVFTVGLFLLASFNVTAQKMEVADVVARHKASIGTAEALAAVKNQLVLTNARFTFKGSANVITGKALILSAGDKNLWGMNFASNDYPQDRFGFDGKDARVGKSTPNTRSLLGEFLNNNRTILKDGLLGGTLSSAWPLLEANARGAKVKLEGTKKIDGKETIVLSYAPKASSDLVIKFYLDSSTHQHLRTEYTLVRAAIQGSSVDNSAGQSGAVYKLVEEFSNFSKMGQLTLPRDYKITYSRSGGAGLAVAQNANRDAEWTFTVTDFGINREIDANSFAIEGK